MIVGDAFFGTYFLLAALQHKQVNTVFKQMGARKRATDFCTGQRLATKDHAITLTKTKKKPDWMTQEAAQDELKSRYKKPWNIEVDFCNLKATMGMDVLSCKVPDMIEKEI